VVWLGLLDWKIKLRFGWRSRNFFDNIYNISLASGP